ncbi:MAG: VWA domain-containing protein, partial [Treponema sp.]|nr:VWA domain-containing protein [Treponema sp.]
MKRTFFVLVALFCTVFSASGQNSGPVDLILVLDTSSSMSGSYREVNDYLAGPFLREFLRIGDTFHLVPFAGEAFVDISRRVEGQGDVQTILGRIFLAYPMGPESDVEGALSCAEQYASTLPASRGKKIVLVTDGGNVPSVASLVDAAKRRLEPRGINLDLVPVPLAALPSSNRPLARGSETRPAAESRPAVPSAPSTPSSPLARPEVRPDGVDAPAGPSPSPAAESPGAAGVSGAPGGDGAPGAESGAAPSAGKAEDAAPVPPAAPQGSPVAETAAPAGRRGFTFPAFSSGMFPYIAGFVILVLLVLGLILFIAGRDLHGSPNRAISRAASARPSRPAEPPPPREPQQQPQPAEGSADLLTSYAASQRPRVSPYAHRYKPQPVEYEGPLMLNLFV